MIVRLVLLLILFSHHSVISGRSSACISSAEGRIGNHLEDCRRKCIGRSDELGMFGILSLRFAAMAFSVRKFLLDFRFCFGAADAACSVSPLSVEKVTESGEILRKSVCSTGA